MGKNAKNLLVTIATTTLLIFSVKLFASNKVDAVDYDAFWLWSGVKYQSVLNNAKTVYLLHGQITESPTGSIYFTPQGNGIINHQPSQLWLVYRVHTLNWTDETFALVLQQLKQWQNADKKIIGLQIDFDVPTRQLEQYVQFLKKLREQLSNQYQLSITGLLDWGVNADPVALNKLNQVVDEVILQTYQGRHTIPNYQEYLSKLKHLTLPFKIGLAQYGDWQAPEYLSKNPWFLGYVVFLQNPN